MIPYFATTAYTTVASAALTITHFLKPEIELNQIEEFRIWQQTTILPTRASSIFAIAKYALEKGCKVKAVVAKIEYEFPDYRFYRYSKTDVDNATLSARLLFDQAEIAGVPIEIKLFELSDVNKELAEGNIILLRLNVKVLRGLKRNSSNYVIVDKFDGENYSIIDTGDSAKTVSKEVIQECFDTLESKKHRDHRMLIFSKE